MKVLDIAVGHGLFEIEIARQNPKAEVVAVDWTPVLEVARSNSERAGVSSRLRLKPGSAIEAEGCASLTSPYRHRALIGVIRPVRLQSLGYPLNGSVRGEQQLEKPAQNKRDTHSCALVELEVLLNKLLHCSHVTLDNILPANSV
jgi:hypothetical protein